MGLEPTIGRFFDTIVGHEPHVILIFIDMKAFNRLALGREIN